MHEFHEWSQHMTLVRFSPSWMSMVEEKLVKWRPCLAFLLNWVSSLVSTCTDHGVYGMLIFHHCLVTDWDGKQLPLHRGLYRFLCGVHTSTMWGWGLVLYLGENSRVKQCFLIIILFAIQVVVFDSFFCCYWKQGIGFTMLNTWYIEPSPCRRSCLTCRWPTVSIRNLPIDISTELGAQRSDPSVNLKNSSLAWTVGLWSCKWNIIGCKVSALFVQTWSSILNVGTLPWICDYNGPYNVPWKRKQ